MTGAIAAPADLVADLVGGGRLTGATLSKPSRRGADVVRVNVRPVLVGGELLYSFELRRRDRSATENLSPRDAQARLTSLLADYRQALLHADHADYQILGGERVLERPATRPTASLAHDRDKRRVLAEGTPVPFLVELGVMTAEGRVRAKRYGKFRQVNRFLELVEDVLPALPDDRALRVVDFGSGKSYLTFALHHLLREVHGRELELVGLDLKADVVATCAALAERLGAEGLRFEVGDISGFTAPRPVDLVVSLHACDTATDDALAQAVRWQAAAILAVPCCQHELLGQIENDALAPLLGHGVLKERFAADVTDALRAQLLRLAGYDVQVLQFVDLEHTAKNVLVRALRRPGRDFGRAAAEYRALTEALSVQPKLERLLAGEIRLDG